jgi:hypothetical protein
MASARLEAMSLQPAFALFALFAVPLPCFDAIPTRHDPCGKTLGETARYGQSISASENNRGLR